MSDFAFTVYPTCLNLYRGKAREALSRSVKFERIDVLAEHFADKNGWACKRVTASQFGQKWKL